MAARVNIDQDDMDGLAAAVASAFGGMPSLVMVVAERGERQGAAAYSTFAGSDRIEHRMMLSLVQHLVRDTIASLEASADCSAESGEDLATFRAAAAALGLHLERRTDA